MYNHKGIWRIEMHLLSLLLISFNILCVWVVQWNPFSLGLKISPSQQKCVLIEQNTTYKSNTHTHTQKQQQKQKTPTNNNKADYKHTNYSESRTSSYISQDMGVNTHPHVPSGKIFS